MTVCRLIKFKDFITLQRGFDLPKKDRAYGPYPVVASTEIDGYHAEYKVSPPGVTTGRSGALGEVQYISDPFWPLNTSLWVKNFKYNLPRYVCYFLKTLHLERYNSGAGVPTLNRNHLDNIEICIHDLPEQRKIAAILSAYDDLIENNTRRTKILEETAQLIYCEWFVNFRFPGHENVNLVDSPMGKMPEGWEIRPVEEILEYHIGGGWGKEEPESRNTYPAYVIRGTDIPDARNNLTPSVPLRFHTESNLKARILQPGDIVFEVSGGSKDQPVGRALLIHEYLLNKFDNPVMCASFCKLLRPDPSILLPELFYLHLEEIYQNRQIMKYQVQSTGITNFKFQHFLENEIVTIPPKPLQAAFKEKISPMFDEIQLLGLKNENLGSTRDLLLPKLISGEVGVSELDIDIGEAET